MSKIVKIQNQNNPLTCLTAYSYPIAKILDEHCDIILVGDSLGMALYGMENTREVTLEMMINHGKAVVRATKKALIVVDLPFGSYEKSKEQALESATKIITQTKCDAVKLETTKEIIPTIEFLVQNNIPVMGHVGLLPQRVENKEDYKYQGKDQESANKILQIAKDLEKVGAFSIVIEGVPATLAEEITLAINIPTIGIGASCLCDGQILVTEDLLGLNQEFKPKFVKNYANIALEISKAVTKFSHDVKSRKFPMKENIL